MSKHTGKPFAERQRARRRALQALYQWQINAIPASKIVAQFEEEQDMSIADGEYFRELVMGTIAGVEALDQSLTPCIDRPLELVDAIERAVLRLAAFELIHRPDVPYRVIINEAIELARDFGAQGGHGFVNGVIDKLATQVRRTELDPT
jgi:N utilization substance protein B